MFISISDKMSFILNKLSLVCSNFFSDSGIGQILTRISQLCGVTLEEKTLQSIFYLAINIPLILVSFKNIGKEFTITTLLNVVLTSVFIDVIPDSWVVIFDIDQEFVARALFAGIMTGLSSGSAYLIGSSTGGIDLIAFAIAEKKSTTSGKYSLFINATIIITTSWLLLFLSA